MGRDIDEILSDYLNKELLTEEDRRILEEWSEEHGRNKKFADLIRELRMQKTGLDRHESCAFAFEKIRHKIYAQRRKRVVLRLSAAAVLVLLMGVAVLLRPLMEKSVFDSSFFTERQYAVPELVLPDGKKILLDAKRDAIVLSDSVKEMRTRNRTLIVASDMKREVKNPEYYTMNIPYGSEYRVVLSDGTKVFLNAGTVLRYPACFAEDKREVFLTGEAYFEVASDSLHPFIVNSGEVCLKVLGTAFNINAYPDELWIKTTLVEGKVEARCGDEVVVMQPGMQMTYDKTTKETAYFPVNTGLFISWKDGYYDFEDMPLDELMRIFSRWYDIDIEIESPGVKKKRYSGRLRRYEDLEPLFKMLEYTRNIKFIKENDKIFVREENDKN